WVRSAARRTSRSGPPELQGQVGPVGDDALDSRVGQQLLDPPFVVDRPDPYGLAGVVVDRVLLVERHEIDGAHADFRKPLLDDARRRLQVRLDDDLVRREALEVSAHELYLEARLLQVEVQADAAGGRGEDLVHGRGRLPRLRLRVGIDYQPLAVAADVDLDEVGSRPQPAGVARMGADQHY